MYAKELFGEEMSLDAPHRTLQSPVSRAAACPADLQVAAGPASRGPQGTLGQKVQTGTPVF